MIEEDDLAAWIEADLMKMLEEDLENENVPEVENIIFIAKLRADFCKQYKFLKNMTRISTFENFVI